MAWPCCADVAEEGRRIGHLFVFRASERIASRFCGGTARACPLREALERGDLSAADARGLRSEPAQLSMLCEGIRLRAPVRPMLNTRGLMR